jgi:hypothetical protein
MKRKNRPKNEPLIRLVGWNAGTAALTGLAASAALAAPGDLDPSFGDVGRQSAIESSYYSGLWSVDVQDDDSVLFGGGGEYVYFGLYTENFVGRLLPDGTPDAGYAASVLAETVVYDTALQSDGKLVGVGVTWQSDSKPRLLAFRQRPDGALDAEFGLGGLAILNDGSTSRETGYSVAVDPRAASSWRACGAANCWSRGFCRTARWIRASGRAGCTWVIPPARCTSR